MELLIITNNPKLLNRPQPEEKGVSIEFVQGGLGAVLEKGQQLLTEGCFRLAVDPLGGYWLRPNPFHSLIFEKTGAKEDELAFTILALTQLQEKLRSEEAEYSLALSRAAEDYQKLDLSLVSTALSLLVQ